MSRAFLLFLTGSIIASALLALDPTPSAPLPPAPARVLPPITRTVITRATILSVHDGDSLKLAVEGHRPFCGMVRLLGVFAVELAKPGGIDAQHNLQINAMPGELVRVQFGYTAGGLEEASLGRPLVGIWRESDCVNINESQAAWLKQNNLTGGTGSK